MGLFIKREYTTTAIVRVTERRHVNDEAIERFKEWLGEGETLQIEDDLWDLVEYGDYVTNSVVYRVQDEIGDAEEEALEFLGYSCSLCETPIHALANGWDQGHNGQPVVDGRVCDRCNIEEVIPARIYELFDQVPPHDRAN